jgi:hypothetical protein
MSVINNLSESERIRFNLEEYGFHYIDNFLPKKEFETYSDLALSEWKKKENWSLRISNGSKIYKVKCNEKFNDNYIYEKFSLMDDVLSGGLRYWYYAISEKDASSLERIDTHLVIKIKQSLMSKKYQSVYKNFLNDWKATNFFLTCFDNKSFISQHSDLNDNLDDNYKLSIILYLNPYMRLEHGGNLVFRHSLGKVSVWPKPNRMVLFTPTQSNIHEVQSISNDHNIVRLAFSGWLI